jgi:hypothetical protein
MPLLSASDDFMKTLTRLPGLFGKICYLSALRNEAGEYEHWGLVRTHGSEAAVESMRTAHKIIFSEVLRSSLRKLCSEIEAAGVQQMHAREELRADAVPPGTGKAPRLHFNAVVEAVLALVEAQHQSNHRAS